MNTGGEGGQREILRAILILKQGALSSAVQKGVYLFHPSMLLIFWAFLLHRQSKHGKLRL